MKRFSKITLIAMLMFQGSQVFACDGAASEDNSSNPAVGAIACKAFKAELDADRFDVTNDIETNLWFWRSDCNESMLNSLFGFSREDLAGMSKDDKKAYAKAYWNGIKDAMYNDCSTATVKSLIALFTNNPEGLDEEGTLSEKLDTYVASKVSEAQELATQNEALEFAGGLFNDTEDALAQDEIEAQATREKELADAESAAVATQGGFVTTNKVFGVIGLGAAGFAARSGGSATNNKVAAGVAGVALTALVVKGIASGIYNWWTADTTSA